MKIVTAGSAFLDIDAYGGCVAYAELLRKQDQPAEAVSTAPINESVTPSLQPFGYMLQTDYQPNPADQFVLIDVSDPDYFDPIVDLDRVTEVIDHHTGFEPYWQSRIGDQARIEFIGAACTLVYERWVAAKKVGEMSVSSAQLLAAGIVDNTLDFKIGITTDRDRDAYKELAAHASLPSDWKKKYFHEYQQAVEGDIRKALLNDMKTYDLANLPQVIGQTVVWDGSGQDFIARHKDDMAKVFGDQSPEWCMNVVSVQDNKSYVFAPDSTAQQKLTRAMGITFTDGVAATEKLTLRKEILKAAQNVR